MTIQLATIKTKYLPFLPTALVLGMMAYTCFRVLGGGLAFTYEQAAGIILVILNLLSLIWSRNLALILTGLILVLATFAIISLQFGLVYHSYFLRIGSLELSTPNLNFGSALVLILYVVLNYAWLKAAFSKIRNRIGQILKR